MISLSLSHLQSILNAELNDSEEQDIEIDSVAIDSRQSLIKGLFIALRGEHFDGHDFAQQAKDNGAAALLVDHYVDVPISQLKVKDTHQALGQLAAYVRQQSSAKVVALTGSSGKTTVKEMVASILSECGQTLATKGNLNNDIGVPLTLLRLTPQDQYAVIELGANHLDEIAYTVELTKPVAALVNNISAAHLAGFGSLAGVAKAKGEIFSGLVAGGTAIINAESHAFAEWHDLLDHKKTWFFAKQPIDQAVDFYASSTHVINGGMTFMLHTPKGDTQVSLPFLGQHNISNSLAAAALAMAVGADLEHIQRGLAKLVPVKGRQFPIALSPSQLLIDDTYNANVGSMTAAILLLATFAGTTVLVAGDMAELGEQAILYHSEMGILAQQSDIDYVLTVGVLSEQISAQHPNGHHFGIKSDLIRFLEKLLDRHDVITILIKGSRSSAMEEIVQALQENNAC